MGINWSQWKDVEEASRCSIPATYQIRLINRSKPISISRFLDTDFDGLLSIGMTSNMERRRKQFISGWKRKRGHSEGNLLYLLEKYSGIKNKFNDYSVQYRFEKATSGMNAGQLERILIKKYVKRFGEVPPLNSSIPARYDAESWADNS